MDETRQLLKIFGVAVTDFEAEADNLEAIAARFSSDTSRENIASQLKNVTELCRELNIRWLVVTQRVFEAQNQLLARCAEAAGKCS